MSKKLRLDGRASFSSPLLYGVGLKRDQVVNLRDADADQLLAVEEDGEPIFTQVADNVDAQFDLLLKYPDPVPVVTQNGKFLTPDLTAISVGGTSDLSDVVYDGSNRVTSFKSGGVSYTVAYASGLITVTSVGQQKKIYLDGSGRVTKLETLKI